MNDRIQNLARREAVRDVFARWFRWDEERFGYPVDCPTFPLDTPAFAACFCDESFLECVAFVLHGKDASGLRRESQEKKAVQSTKTRRSLRRLAGRRLPVQFHAFVSRRRAWPACRGVCRVRGMYAASRDGCLDSHSLARPNISRI